jgi:hypothetical protein
MISLPASIATHVKSDALASLEAALSRLEEWAKPLPARSLFYVNNRIILTARSNLPKSVRPLDLVKADVLFDIHSVMAAQCLLKSWRATQLASGLTFALNTWNLSLAAAVSRALVETAVAWGMESAEVTAEWQRLKKTVVRSERDVIQVRNGLFKASEQVAWGTRLAPIVKSSPKLQRTNIMTLVQKAQKRYDQPNLFRDYEILCDAVHPSWGAGECFWIEAGQAPDLPQMRVLLGSDAVGCLSAPEDSIKPGSPLAEKILLSSAWAVGRLATDLPAFATTCWDLCLTGRVYLFANLNHWGIVKPAGMYELCSCGSGKKSRFCGHEFGLTA